MSFAFRQLSEKFRLENRLEFCSTFFQEKVEKSFTHKLTQMFTKHLPLFWYCTEQGRSIKQKSKFQRSMIFKDFNLKTMQMK
jgi:hypothetical protein